MAKQIWEIKHRPKSVADYIFQNEKDKAIIEKYIREGSFPHLLLKGYRGTGKTSLAYLLKEYCEIDDVDFLEINASCDKQVEVIRQRVKSFISSMPISAFKIVFFDEADALTTQAQEALKSMMEQYAESVRFIFTCNKPHKILDEIKSRCKEFEFKSMNKTKMLERMVAILQSEGVVPESLEVLDEYVNLAYPDLRKVVGLMEHNALDGKLSSPSVTDNSGSTEKFVKIFSMIQQDAVLENRNVIYDEVSPDECEEIYKLLSDYITELFESNVTLQKKAVIIIADHIHKNYFSAIKQATLESCLIKLSTLQ